MAERALVTGASGFLGSHLVRSLLDAGSAVIALVRPGSDLWRIADVRNWIEVMQDLGESSLARLDVVYHLAAAGVAPGAETTEMLATNVLGTLAALTIARDAGVRRFVYCGSCFEYGPGERLTEDAPLLPASEYGASKAAGGLLAEAFSRTHQLPVTWLRPFTAYGPFEAEYRLVPSTILSALEGRPVELSGGGQKRDYVYVEDVVSGMIAAARSDAGAGGTFNLCTGESSSIRDVAASVVEFAGAPVQVRLSAPSESGVQFPTMSGDPTHTLDTLGWRATTSLREGLAQTIDWFGEHRGRYPEYNCQEARR